MLILAILLIPSTDYAAVLTSSFKSLIELKDHLTQAGYSALIEVDWKQAFPTAKSEDFMHLRYLRMVPDGATNIDLNDPNQVDKLPVRVFVVKKRNKKILAEHRAFANSAGSSYIFLCSDPRAEKISEHELWRAYHEFEHVKPRGNYQWTHMFQIPALAFYSLVVMMEGVRSIWQVLLILVICCLSVFFACGIGAYLREIVADQEALRLVPLSKEQKIMVAEDYSAMFWEDFLYGRTPNKFMLVFRTQFLKQALSELRARGTIKTTHWFGSDLSIILFNLIAAIAAFWLGDVSRHTILPFITLAVFIVIIKLATWSVWSNRLDAISDLVKQEIAGLRSA